MLSNPQLEFNSVLPRGTLGYEFLKQHAISFDVGQQRLRVE